MSEISGIIPLKNNRMVLEKFSSFHSLDNFRYIRSGDFSFRIKNNTSRLKHIDTYFHFEASGHHILFSGEIFNASQLTRSLNIQDSGKKIDNAELFFHLFRAYRENCIKHIDGTFYAVVFDNRSKEIHLFLDRVGGIKNLFYLHTPEVFSFSSRLYALSGLLNSDCEIDISSVSSLFCKGYILPPNTMFKNIKKIRPGEHILFQDSNIITKTIDRLSFREDKSVSPCTANFRDLLASSIEDQTKDEKAAYLLSGGIDSSTLVAISSQIIGNRVDTYTAAFPGTEFDESSYAQIVADQNDCNAHVVSLTSSNMLDDLPRIIWDLDEPFLDFSVIPVYHLFQEIKKTSSTVVSGDGPDHLFGRYYPLCMKRLIGKKLNAFGPLLNKSPISFFKKIARANSSHFFDDYDELFKVPTWGLESSCLIKEFLNTDITPYSASEYLSDVHFSKERSFQEIFEDLSYIDFYIDGSFGVFSKVGKIAQALNMSLKEPFLSRSVSDFISGLPLKEKVKGNFFKLLLSQAEEKKLLKYNLARTLLPDKIIFKEKGGFTPPLSQWIRDIICPVPAKKLLCQSLIGTDILNTNFVDKILLEHSRGIRDWTRLIFILISFDIWMRLFIEKNSSLTQGVKISDLYV